MMETSTEVTNAYIHALTKLATDPFEKNSRGELSAPMNEPNVALYTASGSESVTLQTAGTASTSAVVVLDPEATLRNGQCAAYVVERFQSGGVFTVNAVTQIAVGRPSSDFTSAGIFSGGLSVENTSSVDTIAGFQTQAVLYSVPADLTNITSTDLRNATTDSETDLTQANCREDGTVTIAFPYHYGQKMALMRDNTSSHETARTYTVIRTIRPQGVALQTVSLRIPRSMVPLRLEPALAKLTMTSALAMPPQCDLPAQPPQRPVLPDHSSSTLI